MHVGEVEHRSHPTRPLGDLDDVVDGAEVAYAAHHLDSERHSAVLALEPLAEGAELLHDGRDRVLVGPAEQKARVKYDHLGPARSCDPGAPVERSDRGGELPSLGLEVTHEPEQRRVHRQRHVGGAGDLAELLGPPVIHPEAALEVDLTGVVPALEQQLDGVLRVVAGGDAGKADTGASHTGKLSAGSIPGPAEYASLRGI